ncbi:hypothetical protein ACVWXU_000980 [Streptomyces sp. TE33382]
MNPAAVPGHPRPGTPVRSSLVGTGPATTIPAY